MTRGELMALRSHHERIRDMYSGSDLGTTQERAIAVIDLALRAVDTEADARLGARLRSILAATGHDADSIESAEGEPSRAGLADFALRLAEALREEAGDGT